MKSKKKEDLFEERLQFETMLAELSARFINLETSKIDTEIVYNLKQIVEILGIDRSSVAEFNANKTKLRVTHAYAAPGIPRMPDIIINKQLPWYKKMLYSGKALVHCHTGRFTR